MCFCISYIIIISVCSCLPHRHPFAFTTALDLPTFLTKETFALLAMIYNEKFSSGYDISADLQAIYTTIAVATTSTNCFLTFKNSKWNKTDDEGKRTTWTVKFRNQNQQCRVKKYRVLPWTLSDHYCSSVQWMRKEARTTWTQVVVVEVKDAHLFDRRLGLLNFPKSSLLLC